jgi:hypothetical protein
MAILTPEDTDRLLRNTMQAISQSRHGADRIQQWDKAE